MNLNDYEKRLKDLPGMDFERLIHELLIKEYPEINNLTHLGKQEGRDVPTKGVVDIWFTSKKECIEIANGKNLEEIKENSFERKKFKRVSSDCTTANLIELFSYKWSVGVILSL